MLSIQLRTQITWMLEAQQLVHHIIKLNKTNFLFSECDTIFKQNISMTLQGPEIVPKIIQRFVFLPYMTLSLLEAQLATL